METADLLDVLAAKVEAGIEEVSDDRRAFFEGLQALQRGDVEEASRIFRRAARKSPMPFSVMSRLAQGRCEVVRGREGVALRIFQQVADSEGPDGLRRLAWMEVADLARARGDQELLKRARDEIEADLA